jgi:hypothetical protein
VKKNGSVSELFMRAASLSRYASVAGSPFAICAQVAPCGFQFRKSTRSRAISTSSAVGKFSCPRWYAW